MPAAPHTKRNIVSYALSDGAYRWHFARALPERGADGQIVRWVGTCTDIEDYKRAEVEIRHWNAHLEERVEERTAELALADAELSQTQAKLQAVLAAATNLSIIATDTNGLVTIFNSGAEKMLQYPGQEVLGLHICPFFSLQPGCRTMALSAGEPDLLGESQGLACGEFEGMCVRKDGNSLDVQVSVTPLRSPAGGIAGYLTVANDITARKSLDRELHSNNEKLLQETRRARSQSRQERLPGGHEP